MRLDAAGYEKASVAQKAWGRALLSEMELKGQEHILDLGCGDGSLTKEISEAVPSGYVLGIDQSQEMILHARRRHKTDNVQFRTMDIMHIDFHEQFDVIFSNSALHWIDDHERVLDNIHYALRRGGSAWLKFGSHGNMQRFLETVKRVKTSTEYSDYFRDFACPWKHLRIRDYRRILQQTDFTIVYLREEMADREFSRDSLISWIEHPSIVPFLNRLPLEKREGFRDEVVEKMLNVTRVGNHRHLELFRKIVVHIVK